MKKNTPDYILACENLSVGYKNTEILANVNLAFEPGHFITILGPNGAGKTTLLRTFSRHLKPLCGRIFIDGKPLENIRQPKLAKIMAVVLTDKVSPPLFSVFQFVALGRYPHTDFLGRLSANDKQVVQQALEAVSAENIAHRQFADLSDGERQKTLVARALAQQPQLLFLDEPTAHLDLKHRVEVMTILRDLCRTRGITVVASLHDVDIAAKVSDRVALVKNGAVIGWGTPEKMLRSKSVAELYDFESAGFNRHLGSIELRSNGDKGRVFVLGGLGSGAIIYRLLAKRGYAIATGVIHTNDIDYYVARALGADCAAQEPLTKIGGAALDTACTLLKKCDWVIDTGFDLGPMNHGNMELLKTAIKMDKKIYTLRNDGLNSLLSGADGKCTICNEPMELITNYEKDVGHHHPAN